jgi:hypothetical protein
MQMQYDASIQVAGDEFARVAQIGRRRICGKPVYLKSKLTTHLR